MKKFVFVLIFVSIASKVFAFDHSHKVLNGLLHSYVKNGLVDYQGMKKESGSLDGYLSGLSSVSPAEYAKFSKDEKLAFLINAYNAYTIKLILDHYPVRSIKDIGSLFQSPWKIEFFTLLGAKRNLDWIEHQNLRTKFQEPRIHFAIVCASMSCPILRSEAYTAARLDSQLTDSGKRFLNDPYKNKYESGSQTARISKIFDWFEGDFTKKGSLLEFLNRFRKDPFPQNASIKYFPYDWSLNKQK